MREAGMKCKVAVRLLPSSPDHFPLSTASRLPFPDFPARLTRSRKLAAEGTIGCECNFSHSLFSAQTKQAKREMTGKNSRQKSISSQMNISFAPDNTFAHSGPLCQPEHSNTVFTVEKAVKDGVICQFIGLDKAQVEPTPCAGFFQRGERR